MLQALINDKLIDYVAMDIKAPLDKYEETTSVKLDWDNIQKSVKIIMTSDLPYEFRTTVVPGLLLKEDFHKMGELIKGANKWYLQNFKSDTELVDASYKKQAGYTAKEMAEFAAIGRDYTDLCEVRG
jgi:pyruvate formate lyase activating enzyme